MLLDEPKGRRRAAVRAAWSAARSSAATSPGSRQSTCATRKAGAALRGGSATRRARASAMDDVVPMAMHAAAMSDQRSVESSDMIQSTLIMARPVPFKPGMRRNA